ncbi:hypothetical protein BH23ACT5_BH23ACT5_07220 [soil metagenome]
MKPPGRPAKSRTIRNLERFDPVTAVFVVHGVALLVGGAVLRPMLVAYLLAALALVRLGLGWMNDRGLSDTQLVIRTSLSIFLVAAVVVADGGTESPFFFWMILLLSWQALIFTRRQFVIMGALMGVAYLAAVIVSDDITAASGARLGLFAALFAVLLAGRIILESHEVEIRRLDGIVGALVEDAALGVAVFDSNRDTLLYSNDAARAIGFDTFDGMARLLPVRDHGGEGITTLAGLVMTAGFDRSVPQTFHRIGQPERRFWIGFHPHRLPGADPVVLVYGNELAGDSTP